MDRRALLHALAGGLGSVLVPAAGRAGARERIYLGARIDAQGHFGIGAFDSEGSLRLDLPLPARGHGFAMHPHRPVAVCFARRPGTFAVVCDLERGERLAEVRTPADRHFYGHGVYAADGGFLYASENDYSSGRGVIGVYVPEEGYRRAGELPSHGIGPHEIALLPGCDTLVVANGGIATHPDAPGVKLNLPSMEPSLTYVDRRDGSLLERVVLPRSLRPLSIRHVAVAPDGRVAAGMQYEGPRRDLVPLVGVHRRGHAMSLFGAPDAELRGMRQYCGSVAFDSSGRIIAASAPRGDVVTFWDAGGARYLGALPLADGSGVAPTRIPARFLASSGRGGAVVIDARGHRQFLNAEFTSSSRWDNHLAVADLP